MRPSSPSSFFSLGLEDQWQQQSNSGSALQTGYKEEASLPFVLLLIAV